MMWNADNARRFIQWTAIFSAVFIFVSCSMVNIIIGPDHFEAGMEAYESQDYEKAVDELREVKTTHEQYPEARVTLAKAQFKIHLKKFKAAATSAVAIENLRQMYNYAKKSESKETFKELLDESLAALKEAKDSKTVKALLSNTVAILQEHGDLAEVKEILTVMAARMKDFLFDKDVRGSFMSALKEVKMLGR